MTEVTKTTRRNFLSGATTAIALPWIVPSSVIGAGAPSERLTMALIGKGIMGSGHLNRLIGDKGIRVLAVCETDKVRRDDAKSRVEERYAAGIVLYEGDHSMTFSGQRLLDVSGQLDGQHVAVDGGVVTECRPKVVAQDVR